MTEKEYKEMQIRDELYRIKDEISLFDYIGTKIAMGVATIEEYAIEIEYTEKLREKIRELEKQLSA